MPAKDDDIEAGRGEDHKPLVTLTYGINSYFKDTQVRAYARASVWRALECTAVRALLLNSVANAALTDSCTSMLLCPHAQLEYDSIVAALDELVGDGGMNDNFKQWCMDDLRSDLPPGSSATRTSGTTGMTRAGQLPCASVRNAARRARASVALPHMC